MKNMDKIKIDIQMLIIALEDLSGMREYYLNLKSGEIILISSENLPEDGENKKEIENHLDDFLAIIPIPSSKAYQIMKDFAEQLPLEKLKIRLLNVVNRKKPFSNFKDVLLDFPAIRKQWFKYHHDKMEEIVKEWLYDNQIEADLI